MYVFCLFHIEQARYISNKITMKTTQSGLLNASIILQAGKRIGGDPYPQTEPVFLGELFC